jgi:hypothetical protein
VKHDARTPRAGCRCAPCRSARARVWHSLSAAQRHQTDLQKRDGIRWRTIGTLLLDRPDRPALVREHQLGERNWHARTMPFFTLNQHGHELIAAMCHHERKSA